MLGQYVPPVRTQVSPLELQQALAIRLTEALGHEPSEHALIALVAMSAFETGRWKSCWNYNLGNVKATETWPGQYTCLRRVREVIRGVERWFSPEGETAGEDGPVIDERYTLPPGHPATRFVAFSSLDQGASAWVEKLLKRYRGPVEDLLAGASTDTFIAGLKNLNYFTGDLDAYQSQVASLYREFGGPAGTGFPLVK